jgi:hypothetical protein
MSSRAIHLFVPSSNQIRRAPQLAAARPNFAASHCCVVAEAPIPARRHMCIAVGAGLALLVAYRAVKPSYACRDCSEWPALAPLPHPAVAL